MRALHQITVVSMRADTERPAASGQRPASDMRGNVHPASAACRRPERQAGGWQDCAATGSELDDLQEVPDTPRGR
jgi:hypothetical protein